MLRLFPAVLVLVTYASTACAQSPQPTVHHFTTNMILVEHGDTLTLIQSLSDSAKAVMRKRVGREIPDTLTLLVRGDSMFVLARGRTTPVQPAVAKEVRAMFRVARDDELRMRMLPRQPPE